MCRSGKCTTNGRSRHAGRSLQGVCVLHKHLDKLEFNAPAIDRPRRGGDSPPGHFANKMQLPEGNQWLFPSEIPKMFSFSGGRVKTLPYNRLFVKLEFSLRISVCKVYITFIRLP